MAAFGAHAEATGSGTKSVLAAATKAVAKASKPTDKKSKPADANSKLADKASKSADKNPKTTDKKSKTTKKTTAAKSKDHKSAPDKTAVSQIALVPGPAPQTSESEIALVRSAIGALRNLGASKTTGVEATISDPLARKLVEWIILRSEHNGANSERYLAFITANPNWPSLAMFRRRAEAALWVENVRPDRVPELFP